MKSDIEIEDILSADLTSVLRRAVTRYRMALIVAGILAFVYIVELSFAGSLQSGATYSINTELYEQLGHWMRIPAPFLHSNHSHITSNLIVFLGISTLILNHEQEWIYLLVFLLIGWVTASIYPWYFGGGLGWGISGANAGLGGWESVYRLRELLVTDVDSFWSIRHARLIVGLILPATFTILMIGQGTGHIEVSAGVSVLGHFSGAIVGIAYGIIWILFNS